MTAIQMKEAVNKNRFTEGNYKLALIILAGIVCNLDLKRAVNTWISNGFSSIMDLFGFPILMILLVWVGFRFSRKLCINGCPRFLAEQFTEIVRKKFDPGDFVMDMHTHLTETEIQQKLFRLFDHGKLFSCDHLLVDKAGGQTGVGKLVPGGKLQIPGGQTNLCFAQACLAELTGDTEFPDGSHTGTVIVIIVSR